ncbi:MAG TPA: hypothetical protein VKV21_14355 [Solirubrobacteraceae bacterium]|nr:hypothetical protein [Solirubrobacteraceae bacterium]
MRSARALLAAVLLTLALAPGALAATGTGASHPAADAGASQANTPSNTASTVTTVTRTETVTTTPGTPVLVTNKTTPPVGYHHTALQVLAIARTSPVVKAELRAHPRLVPYEYTKGAPQWQVSWFTPPKTGRTQREMVQVYVDDDSGKVTQAWTGFQIAWTMARGYPGAFGRIVNAWYIWLPVCLMFVAPFVPWRRRPTLLHLDLAMFLFFSVSLALFNHADIGLSTPLYYVPLLYLLARLLALGFGAGVPRAPLRTIVPAGWLIVGIVFLMAFRIGLNVLDSNVIDVGFSGVIGADKLIHNVALYGHWPANDAYGDTYGPFNYYVYVPFRLALGWSGNWDSLPAAHGAAIFFDVATLIALYLLGRRWRDHTLGVVMAYAWAAYPFTMWSLSSNTNDGLVALTVTLALLVLRSAPARGITAALAGMTKFAPFILTPLLLRGAGERPRGRQVVAFAATFVAFVVLEMLPVLAKHDLGPFWHDSIAYQSGRVTPFSVWGLWGGLGWLQHALQGGVVLLALVLAVIPARRSPVQVAAFAAALLIALQIVTNYWLYSYIVWFFPAAIAALFASHPAPGEHLDAAWRELEDRRLHGLPLRVEPAGGRPAPAGG